MYVAYLAVLPFYREEMLHAVKEGPVDVQFFAGAEHIDRSVRTSVPADLYTEVNNFHPFGRLLFQVGHWGVVLRSEAAILDLNPRSLSTWCILVLRRLMRRRTILWGHLHPRAGAQARTANVRRKMRSLASGALLYTYDSAEAARAELPSQPVWVAPNALYRARDIRAGAGAHRNLALYVGRLAESKKVELALDAFATPALLETEVELVLVGEGEQLERLKRRAESLGISGRVRFVGAITDVSALARLYDRAICSVSPGYAGLSVTQSLGFGVPIIVSDDEPHAPEIELERFGGVEYFARGDAADLARRIAAAASSAHELPLDGVSQAVRSHYSAEAMASGIGDALEGRNEWMGYGG